MFFSFILFLPFSLSSFFSLPFSIFFFLSICLSLSLLSICLSLSLLYICLSLSLLSICLSLYLFYLSVSLYLFYLSVSLYLFYLSVSLYLLSICMIEIPLYTMQQLLLNCTKKMEQKGMISDHDFRYSFSFSPFLFFYEEREKGKRITKVVVKSHAFLLDPQNI